jgi:hypothetical protein
MTRPMKILLALLALAVLLGAVYLRTLQQRVERTADPQRAEEQARREVTQEPIESPTDARSRARMFWAAPARTGALGAIDIELSLSADPPLRARQILNALIVEAPSAAHRTLPLELTVLEFYLLPDGTAVADFSHALATATPAGILSEQLAVDSIARTLEANVPQIRRLKILIQGQEMDTVAGHVDLTGFLEFRGPRAWPGASNPAAELTPAATPGTLEP